MGRVFRILTISAVLAAANPLPALPGSPSPQAHQGEARTLSANNGESFTDDLVDGIKTNYAKEMAHGTGESPIGVGVPRSIPVEVSRGFHGVGVSVGGIGVDVGHGGVGVDVGGGGVGVDVGGGGVEVDVGKWGRHGVGVNVGKGRHNFEEKRDVSDMDQDWSLTRRDDLEDAANIPYMQRSPVDTTQEADQPSNETRIQARDDGYYGGGRGGWGNGGFRSDRRRGGRGGGGGRGGRGGRGGGRGGRGGRGGGRGGRGGRGGGWGYGGAGGGWGGRGGGGGGWNRIASVDEADLAGSQPSNSTISINPPTTNNQGSGLTGNPNPSKPANSFGEPDNSHSAPVGEAGEFNLSGSSNSIPDSDTKNTTTPNGSSSPIIVINPSNQTGSNDQQQNGSTDQTNRSTNQTNGSTDQTNGSNDQSNDSDGSLTIDNSNEGRQDEGSENNNDSKIQKREDGQDEGSDNDSKVQKRDVIRCNGEDNNNRVQCFCDDRSSNRRWRNNRNKNRVVLDRDHYRERRDLARRDVEASTSTHRHWAFPEVGANVDVEVGQNNDWDDDWTPQSSGNSNGAGGVPVDVGQGGGVGVY